MIDYNPKDWFTFIFKFHKADTFRKLFPILMAMTIYSFIAAYLETHYSPDKHNEHLKELPMMHATLGFVISLLLVFRTNTAYDRWWEGRRQWGMLNNTYRNLSLKIQAFTEDTKTLQYFRIMLPNFAFALKNHLRRETITSEYEDQNYLPYDTLDLKKHVPLQIHKNITSHANQLHQKGLIDSIQSKMLFEDLNVCTDVLGACERIKNTPIPFSYSVFLKKFIFFYIMTLPIGYVFKLGYFCIPVVVFIFYVLASLELNAEEIEDPFGTEANDIPMETICNNIRAHVRDILI